MEETCPMYSSDAFIPFPMDCNSQQPTSKSKKAANKSNKKSCNSTSTSWKMRDAYTYGVVGLHEEIEDFYTTMHPTEQETEVRLKVVENITKTVHFLWPYAKVEVFGSFRTGLYLPSSDIDIVVIGEWRSLPLSTLSNALKRIGISDDDITVIANAKVPIVRLVHTPSKVKVDISFNLTNGVKGAKMVKDFMWKYPPLSKLVLVLKQFLLQRGLNEVYNGGMSSYCLTLLVVSLLQGYHKPSTLPSINLGALLLEFFEHYGMNFNYERVSIHFDEGGNYRPKRQITNFLEIEDPMEKDNNIARGTHLMHQVQMAFQNAFHVLNKAVTDSAACQRPLNSYLSLIIRVDENVLNERKWMQQNYSSIMNQMSRATENLKNNDQQSAHSSTKKTKKSMR